MNLLGGYITPVTHLFSAIYRCISSHKKTGDWAHFVLHSVLCLIVRGIGNTPSWFLQGLELVFNNLAVWSHGV